MKKKWATVMDGASELKVASHQWGRIQMEGAIVRLTNSSSLKESAGDISRKLLKN
jgi:hypothetical protein